MGWEVGGGEGWGRERKRRLPFGPGPCRSSMGGTLANTCPHTGRGTSRNEKRVLISEKRVSTHLPDPLAKLRDLEDLGLCEWRAHREDSMESERKDHKGNESATWQL